MVVAPHTVNPPQPLSPLSQDNTLPFPAGSPPWWVQTRSWCSRTGALWSEGGEHRGRAWCCLLPGTPSLALGPTGDPAPLRSPRRHEELLQKGGVYAGMWLQQQAGDEGESKERHTEKPLGSKKGP